MNTMDNAGEPLSKADSHQFPPINKASDPQKNKSEQPSEVFKPLYKTSTPTLETTQAGNKVSQVDDQLEQARQKGYQLGFEAGSKDACQMANNILAPQMERFQHAQKQLSDDQHKIAEQTSTQILDLALAIAERILGADPAATEADLQTLRQPIVEAIKSQYQLTLHYHPDDLSNINFLMDCQGMETWQSSDGMSIKEDPNLAKGAIFIAPNDNRTLATDEQLMTALQDILNTTQKTSL